MEGDEVNAALDQMADDYQLDRWKLRGLLKGRIVRDVHGGLQVTTAYKPGSLTYTPLHSHLMLLAKTRPDLRLGPRLEELDQPTFERMAREGTLTREMTHAVGPMRKPAPPEDAEVARVAAMDQLAFEAWRAGIEPPPLGATSTYDARSKSS